VYDSEGKLAEYKPAATIKPRQRVWQVVSFDKTGKLEVSKDTTVVTSNKRRAL